MHTKVKAATADISKYYIKSKIWFEIHKIEKELFGSSNSNPAKCIVAGRVQRLADTKMSSWAESGSSLRNVSIAWKGEEGGKIQITAKQAFRLWDLFVLLCKLITSGGQKVRESVPAVTHLDCAWISRVKKDEKGEKWGVRLWRAWIMTQKIRLDGRCLNLLIRCANLLYYNPTMCIFFSLRHEQLTLCGCRLVGGACLTNYWQHLGPF